MDTRKKHFLLWNEYIGGIIYDYFSGTVGYRAGTRDYRYNRHLGVRSEFHRGVWRSDRVRINHLATHPYFQTETEVSP